MSKTIYKGAENIAKLNKLGYPELDGACPTCGINPVTILEHQRTTLKAELLAKMPEPKMEIQMTDYLNGVADGHNDLLTQIFKLVEEL